MSGHVAGRLQNRSLAAGARLRAAEDNQSSKKASIALSAGCDDAGHSQALDLSIVHS
jgi:hypothetical protein